MQPIQINQINWIATESLYLNDCQIELTWIIYYDSKLI